MKMNSLKLLLGPCLAVLVIACGNQGVTNASAVETDTAKAAETASEVDLSAAPSGLYEADAGHRYITFHYDHQGYSSPYVRWREWSGELNWNNEDPTASSVSVEIDVASIDTGVDRFDEHLKADSFFDVENHPKITFVSTAIERTGPDTGKITGDLTIKSITKPVTLDVKFNKGGLNQRSGRHKIGFSGTTKVLRSDFDVDAYVEFVGDEVTIVIETEFDEVKDAE